MKEEIGFLKANVHRFRILEFLGKENADINRISKKLRISKDFVEKTLDELENKNLVKREEGSSSYVITKKGKSIIKEVRK